MQIYDSRIRSFQMANQSKLQKSLNFWMQVGACVAIIALFAPVRITLPWTSVPLVFQNSLFLFLSLYMSPAAVASSWVLLMGATFAGFPSLAGGVAGAMLFTAPTIGYLAGYLLAGIFIAAFLRKTSLSALGKMVIGDGIIWICGMGYLTFLFGWERAFFMGVAPFVFTDLAKTAILSIFYLRIFKAMGRAGISR